MRAQVPASGKSVPFDHFLALDCERCSERASAVGPPHAMMAARSSSLVGPVLGPCAVSVAIRADSPGSHRT
jgi:hypothetical protein